MGFICDGITKSYKDFRIEDIRFELPKGYVLGVIGRNGSGKSTLLNALLGLFPGMSGDAAIDGMSLKNSPKEYKEGLAFVLNTTPFSMLDTPKQIGLNYGIYYKSFSMETYCSLLKKYEVPANRWLSSLSEGQLVRQQIAFALAHDAKVLVLDEPAGNLDVAFREEFYRMLRTIVADGERTVICSSHLMEELEQISDYILYLKREGEVSRVRYYGTAEELREQYRIISCSAEAFERMSQAEVASEIVGGRLREGHSEVLVKMEAIEKLGAYLTSEDRESIRYADLKEIMYYLEKGKVTA